MKNLHSLGLSISIALLLSACGGGGSSTTVSTNTGNGSSGDNTIPASKPALKQVASNTELESLIKQQMLDRYGTVHPVYNGCDGDVCIMPVMSTASPSDVDSLTQC